MCLHGDRAPRTSLPWCVLTRITTQRDGENFKLKLTPAPRQLVPSHQCCWVPISCGSTNPNTKMFYGCRGSHNARKPSRGPGTVILQPLLDGKAQCQPWPTTEMRRPAGLPGPQEAATRAGEASIPTGTTTAQAWAWRRGSLRRSKGRHTE